MFNPKPILKVLQLLVIVAGCFTFILAQSSTATLSGTVEDENSAAIPGAKVMVQNRATSFERTATTSGSGSFTIPLLPPGEYTVLVEREGFTRVQLTNIVLNVGDQKAVQVQLKVGDIKSDVLVTADASLVKTDASVGTVIDQNMVNNIPVSGRTIQTLMALVPGVAQVPAPAGRGQFVVNGQRADSNNLSVDGVSGGTGSVAIATLTAPAGATGGTLLGFTAQGTTAGLVSLDALQEFRIQTSTYSAEFGRAPGGQIQMVSKAGGTKYHGTAFETFRHNALDATDWFTNARNQENPPLRQNMFGGTFSGPIIFPSFGDGGGDWLWKGKEKLRFFFSYEGLRLTQPRTSIDVVPTLTARAQANEVLRPFLNAFPIPTGPEIIVTCTPGPADPACNATTRTKPSGFAEYAAAFSNRSEYDATAIRIDYNIAPTVSFFGRYSDTPSFNRTRRPADVTTVDFVASNNRSLTLGNVWARANMSNDLRFNFSYTASLVRFENDTIGGAALPPATMFGSGRGSSNAQYNFLYIANSNLHAARFFNGSLPLRYQRQLNIVDSFIVTKQNHTLKFGVDYRRLDPRSRSEEGGSVEQVQLINPNLSLPQVSNYSVSILPKAEHRIIYNTLSFFAQDTWKLSRRATIDFGLRWEFVPLPKFSAAGEIVTFSGLDQPASAGITRNPSGTPLYKSHYDNFAPRVGVSYLVSDKQGHELVLRGGFGIYYDLGYGNVANIAFPLATRSCPSSARPECPTGPLPFPLSPAITADPVFGARPTSLIAIDPDHREPLTYQYNIAVQRSLGSHQAVSLSFVGANARRLIRTEQYFVNLPGYPLPLGMTTVNFIKNGGYSDYRALQAQFQRRMHRNIQALVAYTWSRSQDTESNEYDTAIAEQLISSGLDYGNSAFDLRHSFNAAVSLQMPKIGGPSLLRAIVNGWSFDTKLLVRSGLPITNITINRSISNPDFPGITSMAVRPNIVPGQPIWLDNPDAPGGRQLNRLAFSDPGGSTHGNLPRNSVYGFGARQFDAALRREFGLAETVKLKLSIEVFNVLNTPNFTNPSGASPNTAPAATYGKSISMLATGLGGLNSLYQIGGPRSVQLGAKVSF